MGEPRLSFDHDDERGRLTLRLDERSMRDVDAVRRTFLASDGDLRTAVMQELLTPMVEVVDVGQVARAKTEARRGRWLI